MRESLIHRCLNQCRAQWILKRIKRIPPHKPFTTHILGPPLRALDSLSFYYTYKEIFFRETYAFNADSPAPRIIDGGANIGLSVLYFKTRWPDAQVVAFEPDENVFRVLQANVESFRLSDVTLVNAALWNEETTLEFFAQGADAGRLYPPQQDSQTQQVTAQRLTRYLSEPVDMLKLDIEGAEVDVILDCADQLHHVKNLLIEYHSFDSEPQRLDELLRLLREVGFRVQLHTQFAARQPLVLQELQLGMDLQINVFAYTNRSTVTANRSRDAEPFNWEAA